jgi:predicted ATP-grasp superfamily ATP-dependent carboligase
VRAKAWNEDAVIADLIAVGRTLGAKAPLLITKDEPVLWISRNRDVLSEFFEIALPSAETVQLLMDKTRFDSLARERDWPIPRTWRAATRDELEQAAGQIPFPCILKPAVKNSEFRLHSPKKAFRLENSRSLFETYDLVAAWEPDVIVQEWIGGGDERVAFALGYWNERSEPLAVFAGRKLRQWPPECGNTALSEPAPSDWHDRIQSQTVEVLGAVGYRGLGSVEYKVRGDGSLVIMEPTVGRTNYQNEVAVLNGVNLPEIAYYDALGMSDELSRTVATANAPHAPIKMIDTAADRRSAQFYIANGQLDHATWQQSRRGLVKDMLFRADDPGPAIATAAHSALSSVKNDVVKPLLRPLVRALRSRG